LKIAEHTGGQQVTDPIKASCEVDPEDRTRIKQFLKQCVPAAFPRLQKHIVCFYTMTPDAHFVIDRHPRYSNVAIGAGFSGHGFKFTGVLGQALADLAMQQATTLPVEFLSLTRGTLVGES
jgi:glycine/D-amino acid oxidase-like deaminating enzyme